MQFHFSNLMLLAGVFALVVVAVFSLAAHFHFGKRRTPPFLNYFYSDFDPDQCDRDGSHRDSFSGLGEWRAYHRARPQAFEARSVTSHNGVWD